MSGVSLGPWAAKVFKETGRELVLALEQRTYLTLLFPFTESSQFRLDFASALTSGLLDLGIPGTIARTEAAAIEFEPLCRLTDADFRERLDDVEFFCGIEFPYHDDLRVIQRNLNDIPHPNRDPCTPVDGVRRLFIDAPIGLVFVTQ